MPDEEVTTPAAAVEEPPVGTPPATAPVETPPTGEVDWKAQAETLRQQLGALEKQNADFRANEIARVQAAERDRMLRTTSEAVSLIAEHLDAVTPGIKEKLAAIQQKARQEGTAREFETRQQEVATEVLELAKSLGIEVDERTGLDGSKHPEFRTALVYWNQADSERSPYLLERALAEAHVAARKLEKTKTATQQQDTAKMVKAAVDLGVKQALERVGAKDLDGGRDAGGGGSEDWRKLSPEDKIAYAMRKEAEQQAAR